MQIVKTINSLKKKDPKIYDPTLKWFNDENEEDNEETQKGMGHKDKKKKAFKDVIRGQLLEHGSNFDESEEAKKSRFLDSRKINSLVYDEEQEAIRNDFLKSVKTDSVTSDEDDDILIIRQKSKKEIEEDEKLLKEALSEMQNLSSKQHEQITSQDNIEEIKKDEFLSNYMMKRRWLDPIQLNQEEDNDNNEIAYSDDEAELERVDNFESKYNFRFEELQEEDKDNSSKYTVMGHARSVEGSVRRTDESRKKQRESRKEHKERERRQKQEELKRLKNLKRQEVRISSIN